MSDNAHGFIGTHLQPFTTLLPRAASTYDPHLLSTAAALMKAPPDTVKDGPDPEENLWVPAGYTYFGQFVDHDLTFDSTSSLNPADQPPQGSHVPSNLRTPRFDLDNVYGDGPDGQPYMYDTDGATLLTGNNDLLRAPNGRAIIGDKRNDENSIVCQLQLGFIRYHNKVVAALKADPGRWTAPGDLFTSAQNEVRWTYQLLLVGDFLPRIIAADVLADFQNKTPATRKAAYLLYTPDKRANLPREFVGGAYRYGHSGVRTGYRLNTQTALSIFPGSTGDPNADSLLGFDPLPAAHVVDSWERFFPATPPGANINDTGRVAAGDTPNPAVRLQFAYKLDPCIVDPLAVLPPAVAGGSAAQAAAAIKPETLPDAQGRPSLALLNLLRGNIYGLPSGQAVAQVLVAAGKQVTHVDAFQVAARVATDAVPTGGNPDGAQAFQWTQFPSLFHVNAPLWLYVLLEAQAPISHAIKGDANRVFLETELLNGVGARSQLGSVGGRIVAEVFYGLLDEDPDSVFNHPAAVNFKPRLAAGGNGLLCVRNLLDF